MRREKRQGQAGWERVGASAGYTHMTNRGMKTTLRQERKSRRPPDQSYGSAARIYEGGDDRTGRVQADPLSFLISLLFFSAKMLNRAGGRRATLSLSGFSN